ncbi:GFA family protein [Ensifer sp. IC3342]|nr:GFA family protein [Ensifer sp. BRP08]MCA1450906.1 GFA family protein [Ensifer sp. IC3342]
MARLSPLRTFGKMLGPSMQAGGKDCTMSGEITATCLCGAVRISCGKPVGPGGYCHCEDCRKSLEAPSASTSRSTSASFALFAARLARLRRFADSGNELTRHFCRTAALHCTGAPLSIRAGFMLRPVSSIASQRSCISRLRSRPQRRQLEAGCAPPLCGAFSSLAHRPENRTRFVESSMRRFKELQRPSMASRFC